MTTTRISGPAQLPVANPQQASSSYAGTVTDTTILDTSSMGYPLTVSPAAIAAGTANWQAWPDGAVTVATCDVFMGLANGVKLVLTAGASAGYEVIA
jgi:hypothetical protein